MSGGIGVESAVLIENNLCASVCTIYILYYGFRVRLENYSLSYGTIVW